MRALLLFVFFGLINLTYAQDLLSIEEVLADSVSLQEELIHLETYAAENPAFYFARCKALLKEEKFTYPVLHIELLRQLVISGIFAHENEELTALLDSLKYESHSDIVYYSIQLLEEVANSSFHRTKLSDLMVDIGFCDSLPDTPYHYDLLRRSFYRSYTRALERESLFDEASTIAHTSLLLNLPEPYARSSYYDEYLLGRNLFKIDKIEEAVVKFKRTIELIPSNPLSPARNIQARALHYVGICANRMGDEATYMAYTKMAVDSMLNLNTIDAIPPMLDVVDYFVRTGEFDKADRYFTKVDSLHSKYTSDSYTEACILFSQYRYLRKKGKIEEAISTAKESEVLAQNTILIEKVVSDLIEMMVEQEHYKCAFEYQSKYINVLTKKRDTEALREIEQRRYSYELKRQEDEKNLLLANQKQQQQVISMQDQLLLAAISAIFILLVTAFSIAYVSKKLRGANVRLKDQTVELREAKNIAEKAAQAKSDFLSVMSHEIRTPLNAIIGLNKELLISNPREDQRTNLNHVDQSSKHLLELINDILDHNKLDAEKITLEKKPIELSALMDQLVKMTNVLKGEKGVKVKSYIDQSLPEVILGDPLRVRQICTNLCMNAVKFTEQGSVILRFNQHENGRFEIAVSDTGIGIPEETIDDIFEDFSQADKSTARLYGGTGLGLSITKRLADLMGGEINVTSHVGEGSTFTVLLPLEKGQMTVNEEDELVFHGDAKNILIAEDNELNKLVVKSILSRWNVRFEIVSNGKEALEAIETNEYDIVLMDVQMPVMDGLEASIRIRAHGSERIAKIPIIALTASSQPEEIAQMKQAGMDEHILKPIDANVLKKVMLQLLNS